MSKTTALKYLDSMKEKNLVDGEEIGTAKIWFLKTEEEIVQNEAHEGRAVGNLMTPMATEVACTVPSLSRAAECNNKIKVLVADDDKDVIDIIRYSLDSDQFEVLEAANGKEALGMVFARSPDILILDIMMSEMDGYMVCEELKEHDSTKNLPIIILSAKTSVDDKIKAMSLDIDDYMTKPFDPRELEARIKMRLKQTASKN
ncbi:MAG TPA: response regulator transcription factor [Candidatus Methanoperedens sp.]|nr:response regulator transcription factor [Candidatus Methanoperedens sp.]